MENEIKIQNEVSSGAGAQIENEEVALVLKQKIKKLDPDWDENSFDLNKSMNEMGIDSLDSVAVFLASLRQLKITAPIKEFSAKDKIINIIELIKSKLK